MIQNISTELKQTRIQHTLRLVIPTHIEFNAIEGQQQQYQQQQQKEQQQQQQQKKYNR